jgi:hypothetical protein
MATTKILHPKDFIKIMIGIIIIISGVRMSPLGTATTFGLLYKPQIIVEQLVE